MDDNQLDRIADEIKRQAYQLEIINLHFGTNLQYRPNPAVMDTV